MRRMSSWRTMRGRPSRRRAAYCFKHNLCALAGPADVVVGQDADRGAVEIVVLAAFERPQESDQPGEPQHEREGDEIEQDVHDTNSMAVGLSGTRVFASGSGTGLADTGMSLICSPR